MSYQPSQECTTVKPTGEHPGASDNVSQNVHCLLDCDNLEGGTVERGDAVS